MHVYLIAGNIMIDDSGISLYEMLHATVETLPMIFCYNGVQRPMNLLQPFLPLKNRSDNLLHDVDNLLAVY